PRDRMRKLAHTASEHPARPPLEPRLLPSAVGAVEVLPEAARAVAVDPPGELDPELVVFPDLPDAGRLVRLPGEVETLARPLEGDPQHRLAEPDPPRGVGLLRHEVVTLGGVAHRQYEIGEPRRLTPYRSQACMSFDLGLVGQRL